MRREALNTLSGKMKAGFAAGAEAQISGLKSLVSKMSAGVVVLGGLVLLSSGIIWTGATDDPGANISRAALISKLKLNNKSKGFFM
jgi:hypothetical protein